ncbi:MAG: hypothetical protein ABEJ23_04160 [Haloarculaceae archaeon]
MVPERPSSDPAASKSVLFCLDCGHASPIGGDWTVTEHDGGTPRRIVACPDCGRVVATRPRFEPAPA